MNIVKVAKDSLLKSIGQVPHQEIGEFHEYFKHHGPINFRKEIRPDGTVFSYSTNFVYGSIITEGKSMEDVDLKIKDAILTAFEIPSVYADLAKVQAESEVRETSYASA